MNVSRNKRALKFLFIFLGVVILLHVLLFAALVYFTRHSRPPRETRHWQSVHFTEKWYFKVPDEWVVTWEENIIHITDKSAENYYLIGVVEDNRTDGVHKEILNRILGGIEFTGEHETGTSLLGSLGQSYNGGVSYQIGEDEVTLSRITFTFSSYGGRTDSVIFLFSHSEWLDDETMKNISRTFGST
jgi:hypothetical protein